MAIKIKGMQFFFIFFIFFTSSIQINAMTLEEEIHRNRQIVTDPQTPQDVKESLSLLIKLQEEQLQKMENSTKKSHSEKKEFKNSKEWYSYFKDKWRVFQSSLENTTRELTALRDSELKRLSDIKKESLKDLNNKYSKTIQDSDLFDFNQHNQKRIFSTNDGRKSFQSVVMDICEGHIEARDFDYLKKNPQNEEEKVITESLDSTNKSIAFLPTLLNEKQLDYIENKFSEYMLQYLSIKKVYVESRRKQYQNLMTKLSDHTKELPVLSAPPNDSNRFKNYIKDYHKYRIEIDGLVYALNKSIEYNNTGHAMLTQQSAAKSDLLKSHTLKCISLAKRSLNDTSWEKERDEYRKLYSNSTNSESQIRREIDSGLNAIRIDRLELNKIMHMAEKELKNWVNDYLNKNQLPLNIYIEGGVRRLDHWYRLPLPEFPEHI